MSSLLYPEEIVAQYLRNEYTKVIATEDMRNVCRRAPLALDYEQEEAFANFWDGLFGIFPGTASSNNSLEARHSDWQAELQSLGGKRA